MFGQLLGRVAHPGALREMLEVVPADAEDVAGQFRDRRKEPDIAELQARMHIRSRHLPHFRQALRTGPDQRPHGRAIEAERDLRLMGSMRNIHHMPIGPDKAETRMAALAAVSEETQFRIHRHINLCHFLSLHLPLTPALSRKGRGSRPSGLPRRPFSPTHPLADAVTVCTSFTPARNGLHLKKFFKAEAAPFAAIAGLPVAAERRGHLRRCPVHRHNARPNAPRDPPRSLKMPEQFIRVQAGRGLLWRASGKVRSGFPISRTMQADRLYWADALFFALE